MGHSGYGLSQWETTLQCNVVSHWLSPYAEWSLCSILRKISLYFHFRTKMTYVVEILLCERQRPLNRTRSIWPSAFPVLPEYFGLSDRWINLKIFQPYVLLFNGVFNVSVLFLCIAVRRLTHRHNIFTRECYVFCVVLTFHLNIVCCTVIKESSYK